MITTFRPKLNALEARLNLSADPLPVLLVIADQRDFGPEHEIEFDIVAGHVIPSAAGDHKGEIEVYSYAWGATAAASHKQWINVASANIGGHKPLNVSHDDIWVDGRVITGENPQSADRHSDFLWQPVGRSAADGRDFVLWSRHLGASPTAAGADLANWQQNFGVGASAADRDIVLKGSTIGENARRQHGTVTILKEWDANVPHTVGANETIIIHGSRTE